MKYLEFLSEVGKLKDVPRSGWVLYKVRDPESVSDHSFRVALMAMLYAPELKLNSDKCVKMALVHDLEEVHTKDIATRADEKNQAVSRVDKPKIEKDAFYKLMRLLKGGNDEVARLWCEYHDCKTEEARLVFDLDKIEMVLQAVEYAKSKRTAEDLEEFFQTSKPRILTAKGRELWNKLREEYLSVKKK